jgi:6-phosphogluconolactonase (cycloisomerase 2 family)
MSRLGAVAGGVFALAALLGAYGCGGGGGISGNKTALPSGPQTAAPPGDKVVYASLSQDDAVVAYRVGSDGFLPGDPFDSIALEEPRQVLVVGDILYVAQEEVVSSIQLLPDGSLPDSPTATTAPIRDGDASRMIVFNNMLYVSWEGVDRIYTYPLSGGHVSAQPVSGSGDSATNYIPIVRAGAFVYAGTRDQARIDAFRIQPDGSLDPDPEDQDPEARIFDCKDILHRNGILYAIEQDDRRIVTFTIQGGGRLPDEPDSKTQSRQAYAYLLLDGEDRLYASAFNDGRIDLYIIPPGGLFTDKPRQREVAHTWSDTASFPTQMIIDNGILYVSQMGIGRIDAYVLGSDGSPPDFPSSSTFALTDSYLNSITMGSFPP